MLQCTIGSTGAEHVALARLTSFLDNDTLNAPTLASMGIGSSGAEGLAAARLTPSLKHGTSIAPMPLNGPSVQPVLHFLQLIFP